MANYLLDGAVMMKALFVTLLVTAAGCATSDGETLFSIDSTAQKADGTPLSWEVTGTTSGLRADASDETISSVAIARHSNGNVELRMGESIRVIVDEHDVPVEVSRPRTEELRHLELFTRDFEAPTLPNDDKSDDPCARQRSDYRKALAVAAWSCGGTVLLAYGTAGFGAAIAGVTCGGLVGIAYTARQQYLRCVNGG